jgi:hypothetical protein
MVCCNLLWHMTSCKCEHGCNHFQHFQGRRRECASPKRLPIYHITRCHKPEYHNMNLRYRQYLKHLRNAINSPGITWIMYFVSDVKTLHAVGEGGAVMLRFSVHCWERPDNKFPPERKTSASWGQHWEVAHSSDLRYTPKEKCLEGLKSGERNNQKISANREIKPLMLCVGRDSSIGTATRYGLEGPGIEPR